MKIAKANNGIVTSAMVLAVGFSRVNIKYLVNKGMLEKSARGVYILPEIWDDELFNMQTVSKRESILHETALFLRDLTDKIPGRIIPGGMFMKNAMQLKSLR